MTGSITAHKDGAIGWLVIDQPAKRNAVNFAMWKAIPEVLGEFEADPEVRVIVLRGAGEAAFSAGADISEFEAVRATPEQVAAYDSAGDGAGARLHTVAKPTIAMIHGFCVGGGMGIALDCDIRIAGESARFGIPAAKLGIGYDHMGVGRLIDIVGPSFAKEIFYTARQFTAAEAQAMGFTNRVVPDTGLEQAVRDTCATIAANAPLSQHCIKTTVNELTKGDGAPDFELCNELLRRCFESEDYIEGRRAFMEKRKPEFRGR